MQAIKEILKRVCTSEKVRHFGYRMFVCQDENENEPEDESFGSFWIKPVTNEPSLSTTIH